MLQDKLKFPYPDAMLALLRIRTPFVWHGVFACSFFSGCAWLISRSQLLLVPIPESLLDAWAIPVSWFCVALAGAYFAALLAVARGYQKARKIVIGLLLLMSVMEVIDSVALLLLAMEYAGTDTFTLSQGNVWSLTGGLRWGLWFVFNYWFFTRRAAGLRRPVNAV